MEEEKGKGKGMKEKGKGIREESYRKSSHTVLPSNGAIKHAKLL